MITNMTDKVVFYCLKHTKPIGMIVKEGVSLFYACPKYMQKDEDNPDGYEKDQERACANRLSFDDASNIIFKFNKIVEESLLNNVIQDFNNYEFDYKKIHIKILKYSDNHLDIGILNKAIK